MKLLKAIIIVVAAIFLVSGCSDQGDIIGITLSTNWIAMTTSQTRSITATTQGGNASIEWHSSDESIAIVNDGIITAISKGTVAITASTDDISSEPCSVHIAEDWILYSDGDQLRLISPDDSLELAIPGTGGAEFNIKGPLLWTNQGIVYTTLAPFNYSYLWFLPFDGAVSRMITPDTIEPIYDIRPSPAGGVFLTVYQDIHSLNPTQTFPEYINSEHLYYSRSGVKMEGLDISADGTKFITACRLGTSPRLILFDLDGESSQPIDTLQVTYLAACPRFNPTGDKIAYGYATTVGRVWTINVSGGAPSNVITEGQEIAGISWSPDGTQLAMCVRNVLNQYELWIGNPSTGGTRKLTSAQPSPRPYFPQWID